MPKEYLGPFAEQQQAMRENAKRREVRLTVFRAIEEFEEPKKLAVALTDAFDVYREQAALMVPKSIDTWAEKNGHDPEKARKIALARTFDKDMTVAQKFASGVMIDGQTVTLKKLITDEELKIGELQQNATSRFSVS